MKPGVNPSASGLNPYQERRLWTSLVHMDKLLQDVEHILDEPSSPSPFRGYIADVSPEQRTVLERSIREIRHALVEILERQRVPISAPRISALHAIRANLDYVDIAIAELAPRHMKGYGGLKEGAVPQLERIVHDLGAMVRKLYLYLGSTMPQD